MTRDTALTRLTTMLAGEPTLEPSEIDALLEEHTTVVDGGDDLYALTVAAREGWVRKAAKVSGDYRISFDGQTLDRAQVYDHCMHMAAYYAGKIPITPKALVRTDVTR